MKKKALVFIDTDVAIRHFIKNTTFSKLSEAYEIIYVFNNDKTTDKSSVNTPLDSLGLKNIRYTTVPRRRTGKWYFLFAATSEALKTTERINENVSLFTGEDCSTPV